MKRISLVKTAMILGLAFPVYAAAVLTTSLGSVKAYPNPWRADKHGSSFIKFDNMPAASTIKIFTVSAREVKTLVADSNGVASWDRTTDGGDHVASGVYIYLVIDPQGNHTSGKLAIIE